jgi:hypothetical protein
MSEIEFLVRRILKEGYDYAEREKEDRKNNPASTLYRYTNHLRLLNHLEKQFLERNTNDDKD